jgi:hypothetical protein
MMMSWIDDNAIVGQESDIMELNSLPAKSCYGGKKKIGFAS